MLRVFMYGNSLTYQESRLCPWQHADLEKLPIEKGYRVWAREYSRHERKLLIIQMEKINQSTPKSTIIIPCYNEASGIRKTLRSVFNNLSNRNFEVIVVNDGSDDKSTEILSEFALEQPIKEIIENKSNSGYGYSLKGFGIK